MRPSLLRIPASCAILLSVIVGCESKSGQPATLPVQGKVTYKGQPVPKGTVTFQSDDGHTATGTIQSDGSYRLSTFGENDGAIPGHHRVMIIANDADPTLMPGSSPGYKPPKDLVPAKFNKLETSGLEAVVSKEKPSIDFDLN